MTKDEIIRMAQEAGLAEWHESIQQHGFKFADPNNLERFASLVAQNYMAKACGGCVIKQAYKRMDAEIEAAVLAEREACAKVADGELMNTNMLTSYPPKSSAAWNIAAAIRGRSYAGN